ncbi:MAG TPA: tail fiber protein [Xanthobacteraceae bacterium]|jgi:microcystin-dependent protein
MGTPYLGQISMFGGSYAPSGWAMCNGQLISISQNTALYSLLGTSYGGDGVQTFGLPNLQSRLPVHIGQGTGLSPYALGQNGGTSTVTLNTTTMPAHTHTLDATQALATSLKIGTALLPAQITGPNANPELYANPVTGQPAPQPQAMANGTCGMTGGSQPHDNMMPSLCITFIIALSGAYPTRS